MSLPFADNPDKSSIYNDLKVKKLLDLTAEDFDSFRARMDAQGVDGLEDEYRRLLLLGQASNKISSSGVISGSGGVLTYVQSVANNAINVIPPDGEVWKIMGISIINSDTVTGTNNYYTFLSDPIQTALNVTPSGTREVFYSSFSSTSNLLGTETIFEEVFQPLIITSEMYLRMYSNMSNVAVGATVNYKVGYMRLR